MTIKVAGKTFDSTADYHEYLSAAEGMAHGVNGLCASDYGAKTDAQCRKETPIYSGVVAYFPLAWEELARVSFAGNEQHNPGTPLHWDRSKSGDELDACMRHLTDRAKGIVYDTDKQRHLAKALWRIAAALQKEIEADAEG